MIHPLSGKGRRGRGEATHLRRLSVLGTCLGLFLAVAGCTVQPMPQSAGEERADGSPATPLPTGSPAADQIVQMLQASTASWNAGDLDGFLDDYWRSETLTFSGAGGVTRGWEGLRERYRASYWAPDTPRDSLRFQELEVISLGRNHALALGQYVLYRPEEDGRVTGTGFFSLILGEVEGGWKILHDHTTATPPSEEG